MSPGTNIYVVEFWATWCPPCRKSIPHLTKLQKQYGPQGVVFIGVSEEPADKVVPLVASQSKAMAYRVAVDSRGRTSKAWMKAYGVSGIPHAFVVGTNGLVLWHGYPASSLDRTLKQILAGTFDLERAKNFEIGDRCVKHYATLSTNGVRNRLPQKQSEAHGRIDSGSRERVLKGDTWAVLTFNAVPISVKESSVTPVRRSRCLEA